MSNALWSSPLPPSKGDFKSPLWEWIRGRSTLTVWMYQSFISGLVLILLLGIINLSTAQQTDTSRTTQRTLEQKEVPQPYHSERSTNNFLLPSSGTYNVPEPTEYYTPPFEGQKYLDYAVEAYLKELEEGLASTSLFQFFKTIAPFIYNKFEFAVYRIYDLPIIERDHPLLDPQLDEKEEN